MSDQLLLTAKETAVRIADGRVLALAGEEALLAQLPPGRWIAGTSPYFMTAAGGCLCRDRIFVTDLTLHAKEVRLLTYESNRLAQLYEDADENEVSLVILAAGSAVHREFALNAPNYPAFAMHPLVGWVAGTDLAAPASVVPKVFCGTAKGRTDCVSVLRFRLPVGQYARIDTINLFRPGAGAALKFIEAGFAVQAVQVNGKPRLFSEYLVEESVDTRLPLVADHCGTMINVAFKDAGRTDGRVEFFAPVWPGIEYRFAAPMGDYVTGFEAALQKLPPGEVLFSCNCILNYLYSRLEGRSTGSMVGPITFGEIAYQLLTQTLACLTVGQHSPNN